VTCKEIESSARCESNGCPRRLLPALAHLAAGWLARARLLLFAALTTGAAILPSSASAHAIIVSARPAMGATLPQGEFAVRLEFNSRIDRQRSRIILRQPDGGESRVVMDADAPPNVLSGRAAATIAGRWRLDWQVLSIDGHITRGEVPFSVREKAPAP
jgi:methionine-rich copper-binding protein CopC